VLHARVNRHGAKAVFWRAFPRPIGSPMLALAARRRIQRGEHVFEPEVPAITPISWSVAADQHLPAEPHRQGGAVVVLPAGARSSGLPMVCRRAAGGAEPTLRPVESPACSRFRSRISRKFLETHLLHGPGPSLRMVLASRLRPLGDMLVNLVADDVHTRLIKLLTRLSSLHAGVRVTSRHRMRLLMQPARHQEIATMDRHHASKV